MALVTGDPSADGPGPCPGTLDVSQAQEYLQNSYVRAIAAAARCTVRSESQDINGVDMTIVHQAEYQGEWFYAELDVQLKSTRQIDSFQSDHVKMKLQREHYDKLRTTNVQTPRILVVMRLPNDPSVWVAQNEDLLSLSHCAYWVSLRGEPAIGTASKMINVPRANVFSVDSLVTLMHRSRTGQSL